MVERLRISWQVAGVTLQVLQRNTDLLIFPIGGLLALSVVMALLAGGLLVLIDFKLDILLHAPVWVQLAVTFVIYLLGHFVLLSANTAMVGVAMQIFDGKPATLADGWRIARRNRGNIFRYALFIATIGLALRLLSRWIGQWGRFVVPVMQRVTIFAALNLAWHVVPVMVVPVMIVEGIDPVTAIKRSSQLVIHAWGEGVVQNANIGLVFFLPMTVSIAGGIAAIAWIGWRAQEVWVTTALYLAVMLSAMIYLLAAALGGIFSAVVYRYASALPIPLPFEQQMLSKTFKARPSRILRFLRSWWGRLVNTPNVGTGEIASVQQAEDGAQELAAKEGKVD
jgi:hypothetical protein